MTEALAIIPARGGSKGIPRKNVLPLCGKPLIAWTIEAAIATADIDRVVVSTDNEEIAKVALDYGAEVVQRPAEISGDIATSESALLHTLEHLLSGEDYSPELVVFLQPTSPIRQSNDIQNAIEILQQENADSLFSTRHIEGYVWCASADGLAPVNYDPTDRKRRQELDERLLEENGSIYVFKPWVLKEYNSRLGGKIAVYQMDELDSFQIDTPNDIDRIAQLLAMRRSGWPSQNFAAIRLLVLDFDGVLTDNCVSVHQDGTESVRCHRGDGWGIARLKDAGVEVVVLSTETNPVVAARCRKLDIDGIQGCDNKLSALQQLAMKRDLTAEQVAFVGNDVNDLECLNWVGAPIVVSDAVSEVQTTARLITSRPGGWGAVREVCDWIIAARS